MAAREEYKHHFCTAVTLLSGKQKPCVCIQLYMIPLSFCMLLFVHICRCPVLLYDAICLCPVLLCCDYVLLPCHSLVCQSLLNTHTSQSFLLFQFLILLKFLFSGGNRFQVSIVPLSTPKPIKSNQLKVRTIANAIQYVLTE